MGERAIQNRIRRLKELEEQQKALEAQINSLKDEIKADMEEKGVDELEAGTFIVRWKQVLSNKFDSKAFQKEHEGLYSQYMKRTESRRFTIV